jgi:hypothetical protein
MQIKVGSKYKTRCGETVVVESYNKVDNNYLFIVKTEDSSLYRVTSKGYYWATSPGMDGRDLVEEITPLITSDKPSEERAKKAIAGECKADYSLIPKAFMDALAYSLMAGALKHGRNNYLKGHNSSLLSAAAVRHIKEYEDGEDFDVDCSARLIEEYGKNAPKVLHLACAAANLLMLIEEDKIGVLEDDREYRNEKLP